MITPIQLLEALLFSENEPLSYAEIARLLSVEHATVPSLINELEQSLTGRGIVLITQNETALLGTHPAASEVLQAHRKEALGKELSKAAIETLAIILYQENVSKGDIDFIRGVNSGFILRNLLIRGLISAVPSKSDGRKMTYIPTIELLQELGTTNINELPDRDILSGQLQGIVNQTEETNE